MSLIPINFTDPGFDPAYTADFELLVIVNEDTFSYAIRRSESKIFVRVSTGNDMTQLFVPSTHPELIFFYQKVVIAAQTNSFCLIPDAVFTHENLLDYANFLVVKEADVILTDQITGTGNTVVFTFSAQIIHKLEALFNTKKIEFAAKSWVKTIIEAKVPEQNLYLCLEENRLQVFFPDGQNIRFYNQFDCLNKDELVYYPALVAGQLKLKPEETSLILCGNIEAGGEPMLFLQRFFKDVTLFGKQDYQQHASLPQHQMVQFLGLS